MRYRSTLLSLLLLILLLTALPVRAQTAQQGTRLECSFEVQQVADGEEALLSILIWNVQDLYAYQFELQFNPQVVEVIDADLQRAGDNAVIKDFLPADLVIYNQTDPNLGRVSIGASAAYPTEPVSGSGMLAQVRLRALEPGLAEVGFASFTLADENAGVISAVTSGCSVQVVPSGNITVTPPQPGLLPPAETPIPPIVATAVAGVVASVAPDGTALALTGTATTPEVTPAEPDEPQQPGGFWMSALIGFGGVVALAALALVVLWLAGRSRGG
jgi:hypothetical protein